MTDEEKIRKCIELVWNYEEIYDNDDLINFQNKELGTYTQYDNILNKLNKYTQLEKENAELKAQIKKMECCGNCKHYNYCPMQSNKECQRNNNTLKYKWELAE